MLCLLLLLPIDTCKRSKEGIYLSVQAIPRLGECRERQAWLATNGSGEMSFYAVGELVPLQGHHCASALAENLLDGSGRSFSFPDLLSATHTLKLRGTRHHSTDC